MTTVTMSTKGQIVIPKELREGAGFGPGDRITVRLESGAVVLERGDVPEDEAGGSWQRWRGILRGTEALQDLEREHRHEVERDAKLP